MAHDGTAEAKADGEKRGETSHVEDSEIGLVVFECAKRLGCFACLHHPS